MRYIDDHLGRAPRTPGRAAGPASVLVLHYTELDFAASLAALTEKVSSHYLVAENGDIYRLVAETDVAWHAGLSSWRGRIGVNPVSIGIEVVHPGDVRVPYPEPQVGALVDLCIDILGRNGAIARRNVVGHSDIAPRRKIDPGPRFPWRRLADAGVGLWSDATQYPGPTPDDKTAQRWLKRLGYKEPHAYVERPDGNRYVDAASSEAGKVVVGGRDLLRSFQLHFRPARADGVVDGETMARLRDLLRQAGEPLD